MTDGQIADIQSFVNELRLPENATHYEKMLRTAVETSLADLLAEVQRLRRENDQLIEAARLGATVVHGDCTIPAGSEVGFLFVLGGEVKIEECEQRLMYGLDSQIGTSPDEAQIVEAVQS